MNDHRRYRDWSAAYVIGALDPDDRATFETHLATCVECQKDIVDLAPLPALLRRVDPEHSEAAPERIAALGTETIRTEWTRLDRSRRTWRWAAAVAGLAAVIALLLPLATAGGSDEGRSLVFEPGTSTSGTVLVIEKAWGTAVQIDVTNLPDSDRYVAWAVTDDGHWETLATWGPTPTSNARVAGASSVATGDLDVIVITTDDRTNTVAIAEMDA